MVYYTDMCWKCGKPITQDSPVGRSSQCEVCGSDLRVCRNCRFYEPGARYDCHETVDEQVYDKENSNFCGYFQLDPRFRESGASVPDVQELKNRHKKAFDNLFGE